MLAVAQERAEQAGLRDVVAFQHGDGEKLEIDDASFDVCLSLCALPHFPNPEAALREMFRCLRPGGRLAIGLGSGPSLNSLDGIRRVAGRFADWGRERTGRQLAAPSHLVGILDRLGPPPPAPELATWATSGPARRTVDLVRHVGFIDARTFWRGRCDHIESPEEFWDIQSIFSSVARKRLLAMPDDLIATARARVIAESRRVLERGGRLIFRTGVFFLTARRGSGS